MTSDEKIQPHELGKERESAILVLADGTCFSGVAVGASGRTVGEVVFNTGMTGYQEVLTDPSYRGQVVTFTAPHIGNYGVNEEDGESTRIQAVGAVVREVSRRASNHRSVLGFEEWLNREGIVAIGQVDTRALTRHLREGGVNMGVIVHGAGPEDAAAALSLLERHPDYGQTDFVEDVATTGALRVTLRGDDPWESELQFKPVDDSEVTDSPHVVVVDFGVKFSILRHLLERDVTVTLVPRDVDDQGLANLKPDGILFSNGPGDPARLENWHPRIRAISESYPTFGICLGHQLLAGAYGAKTYKLPYGHRGPNQPVKKLSDQTVAITSQNHGFCVDRDSMPECLEITEVNLNDDTVAGFRHRTAPIVAVQYHPEAGPGPRDATSCFDEFVDRLRP